MTAVTGYLRSPQGGRLLASQQRQLDRIVANVFGYHGLQLSVDRRRPDGLSSSQILHAQHADLDHRGEIMAPVVARLDALPWCSGSFDLIVTHHVCDVAGSALVPELCRILDDGGVLCVIGFNPLGHLLPTRWVPVSLGGLPRGLRSRDATGWGLELRRGGLEVLLTRGCWDSVSGAGKEDGRLRRRLTWLAPSQIVVARKRSRRATPLRLQKRRSLAPAWGRPSGA